MQPSNNKTSPPSCMTGSKRTQPSDNLRSFEPVYLDPEQLRFRYDGGTLTLRVKDGTFYPHITLRRCFPLSSEDILISIRYPDDEDSDKETELGIVRDCSELDQESQLAVTRHLKLHYFVPVIQDILELREEFGFLHWKVKTNRGEKEFIMRDSPIHSVRQVALNRYLLIDINQTRYEIHDFEALNAHCQELLRRYLLL